MLSPDVCLDLDAAAADVDRTGRIQLLCQGIDVLAETRGLDIVWPELLIHRSPGDYGRIVSVTHDTFGPLTQEVTGGLNAIELDAPARELGPCQIAKLVGPIMETLLEHLLVQSRTVESGALGKLDVMPQRLV